MTSGSTAAAPSHSLKPLRLAASVLVLSLASAPILAAQQQASIAEQRATRAFNEAKKNPLALRAFLQDFPKGADLHMHLSGAVYAETFLAEAIRENLCVDPAALKLAAPPCKQPILPASALLTNQPLYDKLIDAFSMRSFVPYSGWSGHDQFFDTFSRWSALESSAAGEWLDEVATRAAEQNEQYLEIMQTPTFSHAAQLGYKLGWPAGSEESVTPPTLAALRTALLAQGLRDEVPTDIKEFAGAKAARSALEHCGENAAPAEPVDPTRHEPCSVQIRWLYQVLRGFPPQQVFAQTLLGFEVASADPTVVGLNFVMPEDGRISMQDYHLQMQMLDYLHTVYPRVHITLHAGELAPGLVTPHGLQFHIREAVDLGHAERIGHGVDVMYEDRPNDLLKELAAKHIMIEINLTSNDVILGIKGAQHPLALYRAAHVPWALSTDDEGVSRIDLTHEYEKGVEEQDLTYADLKQSARTSLEHSFLRGASLYLSPDDYTHRTPACTAPITPTSKPPEACQIFLLTNEKAAAQYNLERRFTVFESAQH